MNSRIQQIESIEQFSNLKAAADREIRRLNKLLELANNPIKMPGATREAVKSSRELLMRTTKDVKPLGTNLYGESTEAADKDCKNFQILKIKSERRAIQVAKTLATCIASDLNQFFMADISGESQSEAVGRSISLNKDIISGVPLKEEKFKPVIDIVINSLSMFSEKLLKEEPSWDYAIKTTCNNESLNDIVFEVVKITAADALPSDRILIIFSSALLEANKEYSIIVETAINNICKIKRNMSEFKRIYEQTDAGLGILSSIACIPSHLGLTQEGFIELVTGESRVVPHKGGYDYLLKKELPNQASLIINNCGFLSPDKKDLVALFVYVALLSLDNTRDDVFEEIKRLNKMHSRHIASSPPEADKAVIDAVHSLEIIPKMGMHEQSGRIMYNLITSDIITNGKAPVEKIYELLHNSDYLDDLKEDMYVDLVIVMDKVSAIKCEAIKDYLALILIVKLRIHIAHELPESVVTKALEILNKSII